jgi:hypothetical protein
MPRGDGTGPNGQGPMTGRRMGFCAGFNVPGFMNPCFGRGFGRGFAWRASQPVIQPQVITEAEEKGFLEDDLKALKQEMEEIEKRLKELK